MTTILPHPSALEGQVKILPSYTESHFPRGSAILCRNTAPLVAFAYSLLHRDIPCRIMGKDIGKQLAEIVRKRRATNLEDLEERLSLWREHEVERLISRDLSPERVYDQYDCLIFFISGLDDDSRSVASLLAKIDLMFTDDSSGAANRITLSTIHKAKGLEFPTVFILDRHLMPSKYATQPWQQQQEKNLQYVAVTRAKENLFFIRSESWKEQE